MFALLGFRFTLMAELYKIRKNIDRLLDLLNKTTDNAQRADIKIRLDRERVKLDHWKQEHGYG